MESTLKQAKYITHFTIDRTKWHRDAHEHSIDTMHSALYTDDGSQCCIGHYGSACGIEDKILALRGSPLSLSNMINVNFFNESPFGEFFYLMNQMSENGRYVQSILIEINDNPNISDLEREEQIIKEFAKIGIIVDFIN